MESEEVIRRRMEQTREALTEKLETLEKRVTRSVAAVTDTVDSVKEKVHEGVESVKDAVDVKAHVDRHPWLMLGGSVLCGYVLGNLLIRPKEKPSAPAPARSPMSETANGAGRHLYENQGAATAGGDWLGAFEPEVRRLKGLALGVTLGTVREMITEQAPPHMADSLRDIVDAVTRKAGGEPIPSSDWAAIKPATPPSPQATGEKLNV